MYTLYGIPNCDSVAKARKWLVENEIEYHFHDYKKDGITKSKIKSWCKQLGWDQVLNKASTTWKELDEDEKTAVTSLDAAVAIMYKHNSSIKRPIIEKDNKIVAIRFDAEKYKQAFSIS